MATIGDMNQPLALAGPEPRELAALVLPTRRHVPASLAIIAAFLVLAAILTSIVPRSYTADATLSFDPQTPLIKGGGALPLTDAQRDAEIDAQLAEIASLPVAEGAARAVDLRANPRLAQEVDAVTVASERKLGRDEALGTALLDHVKARRVGQTPVFTISYTADSAEQAALIANSFAVSYRTVAVQQKIALANAGTRELDARIAELRGQLTEADSKLAAFRLANNLLDAPDSLALEQEVAAARGQLSEARGQAALAGTRSALANGTTVVGGGFGGSVDTTPISALMQQRAATAAELAALLGRYGEKYPDVIAAREKLAALDEQLAAAMHGNRKAAEVEARAAAARAGALTASLKDADGRLAATLSHDAGLLDLQNNALALRQAYQDLLKLRADQTAQRALIQPDAQVIAPALPPLRPRFPRLGIDLLAGLIVGLVVAVGVAFMRESWLHRLASVEDIARWLEVDYFAPLPKLATDPVEAVMLHPHSAFAQSFRSLATAALFAGRPAEGGGGRVIGITSALAGEGKTVTAIAMGRVLAVAGTKVVLVDADPGNVGGRSVSQILAAGASRGWRDVLKGQAQLAEVLRIDSSGLAVLPAASSDPDTSGLAEIVTALRRDYEVMIIDSPAILHPSHGQPLPCVDALVLLARWRSTPVRTVRAAIRQITVAGGQVTGVALSLVGRD